MLIQLFIILVLNILNENCFKKKLIKNRKKLNFLLWKTLKKTKNSNALRGIFFDDFKLFLWITVQITIKILKIIVGNNDF